jgi:hypothetical protein
MIVILNNYFNHQFESELFQITYEEFFNAEHRVQLRIVFNFST